MKNSFFILIQTLLLLSVPFSSVLSQDEIEIKVCTSEFPPYNYTDKSDKNITGISTEVVQAVLKELGISAQAKSIPWARAYDITQREENILLHSITRTPEREKLFKWVGVIAPASYSLWGLKSRDDIEIKDIHDAQKYKIGTTNNDVIEQFLKRNEFPRLESNMGQQAYENNIRKLEAHRIDLWAVATLPGYYLINKLKKDKKITRVFTIDQITSEGLYMAFGPKTSDELVSKFQKGLETIKEKGIYQEIIEKYIPSPAPSIRKTKKKKATKPLS